MNIQKEREAFEAWFESRYDAHFMQFALDLDFYVDKHTQTCWEAWQAKAQAVPEGFVLVEKAKLMQIVGSAAIIEPITRGNPLMTKYKTELNFILSTVRAMIEAQEQSHDS